MFGWYRQKSAPKRLVFRYHDGIRDVSGDPLVLLRALEREGGDHWHELVQSAAKVPQPGRFPVEPAGAADKERRQRDAALHSVADLSCRVFGLLPLQPDGSGLTESEQIGVLASYLEFTGGLAESAAGKPISPPVVLPFRPTLTPAS